MSLMMGGSLFLNSAGYQISRSVRLRSSASAYFNRTMAPAGVNVYTFSAWVKRGTLGVINPIVQGYLNNNNYGHIIFKADNTIEWREFSVAVNYGQVSTNAVFRDPSAWYHIVVVRNVTSLLIYVNGVSQTLTVSTPVNAANGYLFGGSTVQRIGSDQVNSAFFDGYLTECYLIDGQPLTPSSFGQTNSTTGVWSPIKYTGTYGTNGFYLNFSDNSAATAAAIGADYSGNGNNWTPNNITLSPTTSVSYDSMLDVPTQWADGGNGRGNYGVLSPIDNNNGTLSSGNLNLSIPAGVSSTGFGNFAMTAGKWYWEVVPTNGSIFASMIGVADQSAAATNRSYTTANGWGYYSNAQTYNNNVPVSYGATFTTNDIIGVAYDADVGSLSFYKNGVSQGVAFSTNLLGKRIIPAFFNGTSSNAQTFVANFGQRPFTYTPPTGFVALNTLNLPTPTISNGANYFAATLWTGDGANPRTITNTVNGVSLQPDLVWIKARSNAYDHTLYDSIRGATNYLISNSTAAEASAANTLQAFNSNGFQVGGSNSTNSGSVTYVGWQWKANGAAVTNTAGSISSQVSAGGTQGFSVVTYTGNATNGATVGHGLGTTPSLILLKVRNAVARWVVYQKDVTTANNQFLELNSTAAVQTSGTNMWTVASINGTTFGLGTNADTNGSTLTFVAYCFAPVAGFSAFGSYTGNGSADGPFVFTGFRPRFIIFKSLTAGNNWLMFDTARDTYNLTQNKVAANAANSENDAAISSVSENTLDILSNGFKLRTTNAQNNGSGATIIFAAFAEHPFKNALAR